MTTAALVTAPAAPPAPGESDLRRRITYLMLFRLVLISLVLGATILLGRISDVDLGNANAIALASDGSWVGAADPRRGGTAAGH